jgi:hypothetical protein
MSTVAATPIPETPSKKVAAEFAKVDMNKATPIKGANGKEANQPDDVYGKFVGEVDLPEEEEPLLVESSRRFVLFPIRYHEVSKIVKRMIISLSSSDH